MATEPAAGSGGGAASKGGAAGAPPVRRHPRCRHRRDAAPVVARASSARVLTRSATPTRAASRAPGQTGAAGVTSGTPAIHDLSAPSCAARRVTRATAASGGRRRGSTTPQQPAWCRRCRDGRRSDRLVDHVALDPRSISGQRRRQRAGIEGGLPGAHDPDDQSRRRRRAQQVPERAQRAGQDVLGGQSSQELPPVDTDPRHGGAGDERWCSAPRAGSGWGQLPSAQESSAPTVTIRRSARQRSAGTGGTRDAAAGRRSGVPLLVTSRGCVEPADVCDELLAERVLEVEDVGQRPVEVIGDVRGLLEQAVGRVRQDPPWPLPATSTVNSCSQSGQVTSAWVWPSWLTRRYRSCRKARSTANSPSTTRGSTDSRTAEPLDDAGQQQDGQVRLVGLDARVAQRGDLVACGRQAHDALPVHAPVLVDVPAREHEAELRAQSLLRAWGLVLRRPLAG